MSSDAWTISWYMAGTQVIVEQATTLFSLVEEKKENSG